MSDFIMQMRPLFGVEEKQALFDYMEEDGFLTEFKKTKKFEEKLSDFVGSKYCFAVNNGTIALTVAALALGIGPGDEVIVPNFTMIATPNSVKILGAHVTFVDVDPSTLCLDIDLVRKAITSRTKAIILVAANGREPVCGISEFEQLSIQMGIPLIEDAAQALGSFYTDGRHVGKAGVISTFSFSAPKIISTGQGGAIITDDEKLADNIKKLKDFGREGGGNDIHNTIGFNFKFTELQAVVGLEQMKKLPERIQRKRNMYQTYNKLLGDYRDEYRLLSNDIRKTTPWFFELITKEKDKLKKFLLSENIGTRDMYPPINRQAAYQVRGIHSVSDFISDKGIWLPSMVQLTDEQIKYICEKISQYYEK